MAKRALLTGITGQDGAYLSEFLLSKGYEVTGITRRSSHKGLEDHRLQWLGIAGQVKLVYEFPIVLKAYCCPIQLHRDESNFAFRRRELLRCQPMISNSDQKKITIFLRVLQPKASEAEGGFLAVGKLN